MAGARQPAIPSTFPSRSVTTGASGPRWDAIQGQFSLMMGTITGSGKMSFRLNFDRYEDTHPEVANQRFYGFKEVTFSSNFGDDSQIREALANEMFRDREFRRRVSPSIASSSTAVAVPSTGACTRWSRIPRTGPCSRRSSASRLEISTSRTVQERIGQSSIGRASRRRRTGASQTSPILPRRLLRCTPTVHHRSGGPTSRSAWMSILFAGLAVNQVVDNWDSYGRFAHNYYLYADPARGGRLVWIPWDNNFSFGAWPFGGRGFPQPPRSAPVTGGPPAPMPGFRESASRTTVSSQQNFRNDWPLISRLLADGRTGPDRARLVECVRARLDEPAASHARVRPGRAIAASVASESASQDAVSSQQKLSGNARSTVAAVTAGRF